MEAEEYDVMLNGRRFVLLVETTDAAAPVSPETTAAFLRDQAARLGEQLAAAEDSLEDYGRRDRVVRSMVRTHTTMRVPYSSRSVFTVTFGTPRT
jgi:hypothetical protein